MLFRVRESDRVVFPTRQVYVFLYSTSIFLLCYNTKSADIKGMNFSKNKYIIIQNIQSRGMCRHNTYGICSFMFCVSKKK